MWDFLLLPLMGFFIGMVASMLGIGGGVFMVPILVLTPCYSLDPAVASGTSLAAIIFTSLSSTFRYSKQRRIDYLLGLFLASSTIPGAFLGSYAKSLIETRLLGIIFAFFLLLVAARMLIDKKKRDNRKKLRRGRPRKLIDSRGDVFAYRVDLRLIPFLGLIAGFISGLLGIGGGAVLVPAMNLAVGVPIHVASATSMFIMVFTSSAGTLTNLWLKQIRFDYAVLLAAGIIFGAQLGANYAARVSAESLRRMFGAVLVVASVRMILKFAYGVP